VYGAIGDTTTEEGKFVELLKNLQTGPLKRELADRGLVIMPEFSQAEVDKILTYAFATPILKQQIIENPDDFTPEEILMIVLEALRGGT
tara:strand:+ start:175 stop:441 length:267 start_codon:yes stop_codon:yes gene_type:complete